MSSTPPRRVKIDTILGVNGKVVKIKWNAKQKSNGAPHQKFSEHNTWRGRIVSSLSLAGCGFDAWLCIRLQ